MSTAQELYDEQQNKKYKESLAGSEGIVDIIKEALTSQEKVERDAKLNQPDGEVLLSKENNYGLVRDKMLMELEAEDHISTGKDGGASYYTGTMRRALKVNLGIASTINKDGHFKKDQSAYLYNLALEFPERYTHKGSDVRDVVALYNKYPSTMSQAYYTTDPDEAEKLHVKPRQIKDVDWLRNNDEEAIANVILHRLASMGQTIYARYVTTIDPETGVNYTDDKAYNISMDHISNLYSKLTNVKTDSKGNAIIDKVTGKPQYETIEDNVARKKNFFEALSILASPDAEDQGFTATGGFHMDVSWAKWDPKHDFDNEYLKASVETPGLTREQWVQSLQSSEGYRTNAEANMFEGMSIKESGIDDDPKMKVGMTSRILADLSGTVAVGGVSLGLDAFNIAGGSNVSWLGVADDFNTHNHSWGHSVIGVGGTVAEMVLASKMLAKTPVGMYATPGMMVLQGGIQDYNEQNIGLTKEYLGGDSEFQDDMKMAFVRSRAFDAGTFLFGQAVSGGILENLSDKRVLTKILNSRMLKNLDNTALAKQLYKQNLFKFGADLTSDYIIDVGFNFALNETYGKEGLFTDSQQRSLDISDVLGDQTLTSAQKILGVWTKTYQNLMYRAGARIASRAVNRAMTGQEVSNSPRENNPELVIGTKAWWKANSSGMNGWQKFIQKAGDFVYDSNISRLDLAMERENSKTLTQFINDFDLKNLPNGMTPKLVANALASYSLQLEAGSNLALSMINKMNFGSKYKGTINRTFKKAEILSMMMKLTDTRHAEGTSGSRFTQTLAEDTISEIDKHIASLSDDIVRNSTATTKKEIVDDVNKKFTNRLIINQDLVSMDDASSREYISTISGRINEEMQRHKEIIDYSGSTSDEKARSRISYDKYKSLLKTIRSVNSANLIDFDGSAMEESRRYISDTRQRIRELSGYTELTKAFKGDEGGASPLKSLEDVKAWIKSIKANVTDPKFSSPLDMYRDKTPEGKYQKGLITDFKRLFTTELSEM